MTKPIIPITLEALSGIHASLVEYSATYGFGQGRTFTVMHENGCMQKISFTFDGVDWSCDSVFDLMVVKKEPAVQ